MMTFTTPRNTKEPKNRKCEGKKEEKALAEGKRKSDNGKKGGRAAIFNRGEASPNSIAKRSSFRQRASQLLRAYPTKRSTRHPPHGVVGKCLFKRGGNR